MKGFWKDKSISMGNRLMCIPYFDKQMVTSTCSLKSIMLMSKDKTFVYEVIGLKVLEMLVKQTN